MEGVWCERFHTVGIQQVIYAELSVNMSQMEAPRQEIGIQIKLTIVLNIWGYGIWPLPWLEPQVATIYLDKALMIEPSLLQCIANKVCMCCQLSQNWCNSTGYCYESSTHTKESTRPTGTLCDGAHQASLSATFYTFPQVRNITCRRGLFRYEN